jgi:alkanesulfonate monooxygenase SsuD/methylene tetrahydromethanopterin reductase-like flavin-dependent oxidoreductase (luciferase family)
MLSRTQPRPPGAPDLSLAEIQNPMIDAYLDALPEGREPRILASRTVFVADDNEEALRLAGIGLGRHRARLARLGRATGAASLDVMIAAMDVHLGTPDRVITSLQTDSALARATDVAVQVHSIDPPHPFILRSIELVSEVLAPTLGWGRQAAGARRHATTEPRGR